MTRLCAILVPALLLLQAGCGSQPYPASLSYPLRSDLIVAQLPGNPPDAPPGAGKLDEFIAKINEQGGRTLNPAYLTDEQRARIKQALDERFGTPAQPLVQGDAACQNLAEALQLQPDRLAAGSSLYKKHCLQCHGLTGDGRGPTAPWVYPLPRDFRQGVFKFVSSAGSSARKPSRADLNRLLAVGIDRTSMPAYSLLPDDERDLLTAYSIHLSVRGEVEYRLLLGALAPDGDLDDIAAEADAFLKSALQQWAQADGEAITPSTMPTPATPEERVSAAHIESVQRGSELFAGSALGCASCHVDYGRQARYLHDSWGTVVRATDLTEGAYRGGKRPLDLFHRIRGGIGASGMPAATSLSDEQVWDLVHFTLALPTPSMLPGDVRERVYPKGR